MDPPLQFKEKNGLELIAQHYASEDESEDEVEDMDFGGVEFLFFLVMLRQNVLKNSDESEGEKMDREWGGVEILFFLAMLRKIVFENNDESQDEEEDRELGGVEIFYFLAMLRQIVLENSDEVNEGLGDADEGLEENVDEEPPAPALGLIGLHNGEEDQEEDREWGGVEILFFLAMLKQIVLENNDEVNEGLGDDEVNDEGLGNNVDPLALALIRFHTGEEDEEIVSEDEDERTDVEAAEKSTAEVLLNENKGKPEDEAERRRELGLPAEYPIVVEVVQEKKGSASAFEASSKQP